MEYQNTMLCCGYSGELKPCKDIKGCDFVSALALTQMGTKYMYVVSARILLNAKGITQIGNP